MKGSSREISGGCRMKFEVDVIIYLFIGQCTCSASHAVAFITAKPEWQTRSVENITCKLTSTVCPPRQYFNADDPRCPGIFFPGYPYRLGYTVSAMCFRIIIFIILNY
jgi:hypothetical protein